MKPLIKRVNTCRVLHLFISVYRTLPFNCSHFSDIGRGYSVSLPASSSFYQVTGLRLGRQYRFSVQPNFESGLGTESSVDEHTGNTSTLLLSCTYRTSTL